MANLQVKSLYDEYQKGKSLAQLGEKYNKHPNTIRRWFKKHGYKLRTQSEAQKNALAQGNKSHPTKGKKHSNETKAKIGQTVAENYDKELRSEIAKANWAKQSDEFKKNLVKKAHAGMRRSAKKGSELEHLILAFLSEDGYEVESHKDLSHISDGMHVDIFLEPNVAIEIDGPTHYEPIWGEEKLQKVQASDKFKNGTLLAHGFTVIRVKHLRRNTTQAYARIIYKGLKPLLNLCDNKLHYLELENARR